MNSLVGKSIVAGVFVTLAFSCPGQRGPGVSRERPDTTLLTGPYLLSPALPPSAPVPGQVWTFVRRPGPPHAPPPSGDFGGRATLLTPRNYSLAQLGRGATGTFSFRPDALEAHRPGTRAKPESPPLPSDPIRFDAQLPATHTNLLPKPARP